MKEIWKDIEAFEGLYQISNLGRVKCLKKCWQYRSSLRCIEEKVMLLYTNNNGYLYILLRKGIIRKKFYVHRLVAAHFLSNPKDKPFVNHIDRSRTNNVKSNLEWVTGGENSSHWMKAEAAIAAAELSTCTPF